MSNASKNPGNLEGAANNISLFSYAVQNPGPFTWSPDSASVALLDQQVTGGPVRIVVVSANGSERRTLSSSNPPPISNPIKMEWSNTGQLAFRTSLADGENNASELFVETIAGVRVRGGARDVDDNDNNMADGRILNFEWSPDGRRAFFRPSRSFDSAVLHQGTARIFGTSCNPVDANTTSTSSKFREPPPGAH